MWMVVYLAENEEVGEIIEKILRKEDILFKRRPIYNNLNNEDNSYEILVPQSEIAEAHAVLMEHGY